MPCRKLLPLVVKVPLTSPSASTILPGIPAMNVTASVNFVEMPSLIDVKNPTTVATTSPIPFIAIFTLSTTVSTVVLIASHTVLTVLDTLSQMVVSAFFMISNCLPTWSTIHSTAALTTSDTALHTVVNCLCMIRSAREMSSHASAIHGATVFAIQSATGLMTA